MYIIPKEKRKRIETEVKPVFLQEINRLVENGIRSVENEIGFKKKFHYAVNWYRKLVGDFLNPSKVIFYEKIIRANPAEMMKIYEELQNKYNYTFHYKGTAFQVFQANGINRAKKNPKLAEIRRFFNACFPYDIFSDKKRTDYNAYEFCMAMEMNVCVYCNAQLTHTIVTQSGEKIIRPQIDHYFPQSVYPMFALSFYNLIPSCSICNGVKSDADMQLNGMYHPYSDSTSEVSFAWKNRELKINFNSPKASAMKDIFKTEEIYGMYRKEAEKIVEKAQDYSKEYVDEIVDLMNKYRRSGKK